MRLELAKTAGFCPGVRRAVEMVESAVREGNPTVTYGPIIHNHHVVERFAGMGVAEISAAEQVSRGTTVIIRSHGVSRAVYEALEAAGAVISDATCPFVKRIHEIVSDAECRGRKSIIIGTRKHPEVVAIAGWCSEPYIFESPDELETWLTEDPARQDIPLIAVSQTTITEQLWNSCADIIKKLCTNCEIFATICSATEKRQSEAARLAQQCESMIVIGDRESSNTKRLKEICVEKCRDTCLIDSCSELMADRYSGKSSVGITAGASTPEWIIKEVYDMLDEVIKTTVEETVVEETATVAEAVVEEAATAAEAVVEETETVAEAVEVPAEAAAEAVEAVAEVAEEPAAEAVEAVAEVAEEPAAEAAEAVEEAAEEAVEEAAAPEAPAEAPEEADSFSALLEQYDKSLSTGDRVTGTITGINATEIELDLGTKHAGYIPQNEISDDPNFNVEEELHVGDKIEVYVMRVNDAEGTVMLSKKKLDAQRNWDEIQKLYEEKTVVDGFVTEQNKGGVVVNVKGIRVFVPASQTGIPKTGDMSELVRTNVQLKVIEVNRPKRRVVGSIRAVASEARRAAAEKIWSEIEVGKKYSGVVKSLTSYGAFVDIGGVDGMVHVSELSWTRIKTPADVVSVGDPLDVYVISFDPEKKKISLGYKTDEMNPWNIFMSSYNIGDVVTVKIVKLMTFGAFAEIIPGIDGLIHISQIADRRIGKPEDVLAEGQVVDAKIIDVDAERKRISLSIRAVLDDAAENDEEDNEEEYED